MNHQHLVSIVIPTHNRKDMLIRLINGILDNDYKNIEIIIVNDASTDDTEQAITVKFKKNKNITLVTNKKNLFTAGSRNKGASLAKGDYIFFIDDDNVVSKKLISTLVAAMDNDDTIGEVGPLMYYFHKKSKLFWAGTNRNMMTSKTTFLTDNHFIPETKTWPTDDVLNAFMVRRSVIKKNNITFIENLGIMYEESDYAQKIKKAGFKIVAVNKAIIYHDVEDYGTEPGSFLYHTLKDKRRVYFTARNRLVFHSLYSTSREFWGIVIFWNWLFAGYYLFNILRYQGKENYSLKQKTVFIQAYFQGIRDGIIFNKTKKL
jgi:GT2 family glycosyltransferase